MIMSYVIVCAATGDPSHTLDSLTEHSERKGHDRGSSVATTGPAHLVTPLPAQLVPQTSDVVKSVSTSSAAPSRTSSDEATIATLPDKADHKSSTQGQHEAVSTEPSADSSKNANKQDQDKKESDSPVVKNKVCGAYGCDGSGIVAVVVVAAICIAIIIVVGAILLKKVVNERRRKKFRNVDYLINGMYT